MLLAAGAPNPSFQFGLGGLLLTIFGTVVVGVLTLAGVVYTARQSRGAQDKTTEIDERRLKLEEKELKLEQQERNRRYDADLIERLHREIGRLNDEIVRLERLGHVRAAEQATRCRVALSHLSDSLETLVSVVRDEVAEEAARDAVDEARQHITTDHPDPTPEVRP